MTENQIPPDLVGLNLQSYRQRLAWTQAQLTEAAGFSERTVQRAEEGKVLSAETLPALAGALDFHRRPSQTTKGGTGARRRVRGDPAPADRTSLRPSAHAPSHALRFDYDGLNEDQEAAIAGLHQNLRDYVDLWRDLEPVKQHDAFRDLQQKLDVVTWARPRASYR